MFFVPITFEFFPQESPDADDCEWTYPETPYEVLDVRPDVDQQEVRAAYLRLSKLLHPDRPGGDEEAFKRASEAYRLLSDPDRRQRYSADPMMRDATRILSEMNVFNEILQEELFGPPPPRVEEIDMETTPTACVVGDPDARATTRGGSQLPAPVPAGATHGHSITVPVSAKLVARIALNVRPETHPVRVSCDERARGGIGVMHVKDRDVFVDFAVGLSEVVLGFRASTRGPDGTLFSAEWPPWSDVDPRSTENGGIPALLAGQTRGRLVLRPKIRPSVDRCPLAEYRSAFQKIIGRVYMRTNAS